MSTKMSKLSFRAKPLDASKPMPVYINEDLPGLPDYSAINKAVPQMPSGMHKEEECEHHLQRAICTGLIIPTPEFTDVSDGLAYDRLYPPNFELPRQLVDHLLMLRESGDREFRLALRLEREATPSSNFTSTTDAPLLRRPAATNKSRVTGIENLKETLKCI